MKRLRRFLKRLTSWAARRQDEDWLQMEIDEHLAHQAADYMSRGVSASDARRLALLKFGAVQAMKERYRDGQGLPLMETLTQDFRHALRRLRATPAFTIATVLTLALGIGATTAIFTLVHALLSKPLPVPHPDELYRLGRETHCCYIAGYSQDHEFSIVSYELYEYLRDHTTGFSELAAFPSMQQLLGVRRSGTQEVAHTLPGEFVSGNYFTMFDLQPYAGRLLTAGDDRADAPPVVVMSYRVWRERFGSDPSVIGRSVSVNDKPFTLVGITPPGFFGDTLRSTPSDVFLPLNTEPFVESDADLKKYDTHWLDLIGRIKPGATAASIEAEMRVALTQWLRLHSGDMSANERAKLPEQTLFVSPGGAGIDGLRSQYTQSLQILMMVTGCVLLLACANVANLMLVRSLERRRQLSLSMALGAGASRVVQQVLTESVLLSLLGGVAGLGVAFAGVRLILQYAFPSVPGFGGVPVDASPSLPVLMFAFGISVITGLAFGIAPAWMTTRVNPIEALRGSGRSTAGAGSRPRTALVVLQIALSLALLSATGLLTTTLRNLQQQRFGFEQDHRLVVTMNPKQAGYRTAQLSALYRRIHDAIASLPQVNSVAIALYSPLGQAGWGSGVWVDGRPAPGPNDDNSASWNRVTAGYFDVVGTPILRGRGISQQDTETSQHVAVISETFARKFFGHDDPIGRHFGRRPAASGEFEVVGVAKDARYEGRTLGQPIRPFFFLPEPQADYTRTNLGQLFLKEIVILTKPGTSLPVGQVQQAMASADPRLPIVSIRMLTDQVASQFSQQRLIARLTSFFGVLSLVLASIGLHGITAYSAERRVTEIGVRMALGASRTQVTRLIMRGASRLVLCGLVVGLPVAYAAGRFLGSQLYGVTPTDAAVALAAIVTLGVSALAAAFVPAFRASLISPLEALRAE